MEILTGLFDRSLKGLTEAREMNLDKKEVREMPEEKAEQRCQVVAIKKAARSANSGRSYLLPGLWACRLAAGLTQRELARIISSNQATVRELERERRGAYISTIRKLCGALGVTPEDLLCGENSAKEEEARRQRDEASRTTHPETP